MQGVLAGSWQGSAGGGARTCQATTSNGRQRQDSNQPVRSPAHTHYPATPALNQPTTSTRGVVRRVAVKPRPCGIGGGGGWVGGYIGRSWPVLTRAGIHVNMPMDDMVEDMHCNPTSRKATIDPE